MNRTKAVAMDAAAPETAPDRPGEAVAVRMAARRMAAARFAMAKLKFAATADDRERLLLAHLELEVWPDVPDALAALSAMGLSLVFLSNMTRNMLSSNLAKAGLEGAFAHLLSTDTIRTYKPDPAAYRMAVDHLGVAKEDVLFVPFAGWDVAGAKWFGYETFWLNRLGAPQAPVSGIRYEWGAIMGPGPTGPGG